MTVEQFIGAVSDLYSRSPLTVEQFAAKVAELLRADAIAEAPPPTRPPCDRAERRRRLRAAGESIRQWYLDTDPAVIGEALDSLLLAIYGVRRLPRQRRENAHSAV